MNFFHKRLFKFKPGYIDSKHISALGKKLKQLTVSWHGLLIVAPTISGITIIIRLLGWLQPMELSLFDLSFRLRPIQPRDERIIIVGIEEADIQKLQQWPLSDAILAKLLTQIKKQKPKVIGLDIYRNLPVEPGHKQIVELFKTTPRLIGIKKAIGDRDHFSSAVSASPILEKAEQVSSNDIVLDSDGILRRGMLFPIPGEGLPSLGLAMAVIYLQDQGIKAEADSKGFMKLGKTVFPSFKAHDGGYVNADDGGYQILLNFRGLAHHFHTISALDVLSNRIPPDLMQNRIVLIGSTAVSLNDAFHTPYSRSIDGTPVLTAGVEIQANLASQILSSVLDGRPLIQVLPKPLESFWILGWVLIITGLGWQWRQIKAYLFLVQIIVLCLLSAVSVGLIGYFSFLIGLWIPVAPPLLAIFSSTITISGYVYFNRLRELNHILEQAVQNLEQALNNLEKSQIQLIQSEKMSALGQLVAGVAHEINNPVGFVSGNLKYLTDYIQDLTNHLQIYQKNQIDHPIPEITEDAEAIDIEYILTDIPKMLTSMEVGVNRIKEISTSLRTFSRSDTTNKIAYNIHECIDSTLLILKHRLKANSQRSEIIIVKKYGDLPLINCYPGQLNQVMMNLVANAIDAFDESRQNQDFDEISSSQNQIQISTQILLDNNLEIRVKDNGPGMSEEVKQKIFESLFTTKQVDKGTGLGLSISQQIIVESHGGRLTCQTTLGEGAEFIIEIPL